MPHPEKKSHSETIDRKLIIFPLSLRRAKSFLNWSSSLANFALYHEELSLVFLIQVSRVASHSYSVPAIFCSRISSHSLMLVGVWNHSSAETGSNSSAPGLHPITHTPHPMHLVRS